MFPELEDLFPLVIVDDLSTKIGIAVMGRELRQFRHVVDRTLQLVSFGILVGYAVIAIQHGFQHLVGSLRIGKSPVGAFQLRMAEETIRPFQGTRFHLHEDIHHVDEVTSFEAEVAANTQELLHQQGKVELQDVVSRQVRIADEIRDLLGFFPERGFVGHQRIGVAMH